MTAVPKPKKTSAERTRAYRERMRAKGLRQQTRWVIDIDDPEFVRAVREASMKEARESSNDADLDFLERRFVEAVRELEHAERGNR